MNESAPRAELDRRIDAIESAYEYCLAYAAQGRSTDRDSGAATSSVREHLGNMREALAGLADVARACAQARDPELLDTAAAFFAAIADDSAKAAAAVSLVLARPDISSQLVDNLNASIHVRALLTDLFVIDEALKLKAQ